MHIAGDPMNSDIRWVKLTRYEITKHMKNNGIKVSRNIVRKMLKKYKFVKRKMLGKIRCGDFADRNKQFEIINNKINKFKSSTNPIISMDTKKKEPLGRLFRQGKVYCNRAIEVHDHTNDNLIVGQIVPHGIYDIKLNQAHINIGTTHETAEFLCDSLQYWWETKGKIDYPLATEILILCDAGGANSWRINVFKFELQRLCNLLKVKIVICHYPPYASKWNPIEHRVFPHVTRAMEGVMLETHEQAHNLITQAHTKTGLIVTANIINKIYNIGRVVSKQLLELINIIYDTEVPGLNYSVCPQDI